MKFFAQLLLIYTLFALHKGVMAQDDAPVFQTIGQAPYSFTAGNGEVAGYHYEIANLILREANYSQTAKPVPLKRLIRDLKSGRSHCIIAATTPFVLTNFTRIEDIGHVFEVGFLPRKGIRLNSYDDLKAHRIGVPAGMTMGEPFDSDAGLKKVTTPDYFQSALMLKHNRIDVVMGALESVRYSAEQALPSEARLFGDPLVMNQFDIALVCNKDMANTPMVDKLREATVRLKRQNKIRMIIDRFFHKSSQGLIN